MVAAFQGAGKAAGLQIWRIENFEPAPYPESDYGKFFCGDSYIVLHTQERKGNISWDIHFWLGNETSQDEAGAAAMLSVELDDILGGSPTQHREVQDHESSLFLGYFKAGIRYLPGGVASGFHHVDPSSVEKRLFHIKGKRNIRVKQLPDEEFSGFQSGVEVVVHNVSMADTTMSAIETLWTTNFNTRLESRDLFIQVPVVVSSMNEGDCFILDAGQNIYLYVGSLSKKTERLKAIAFANQIRDEDHAGRGRIHVIDESSLPGERDVFFEELGSGSAEEVPQEEIGGDDVAFEKNIESGVRLFLVSDADGSMHLEKISDRPLHQDMLHSGDCFILDTITSGIYVWIGKQCSKQEKLASMKWAESFLTQNEYPSWTEIQRVVEGAEGSAFKQYFGGWRETSDQIGLGRVYTLEQIARSVNDAEFDIGSLHADKLRFLTKNGGKAFGFMPDDGSGETEVFRVENFELEPINPSTFGTFFDGDSYVVKYSYSKDRPAGYIIYFWQGRNSDVRSKGAAALHAVNLDDQLGGKAVQVRVTQDDEPRHFLRIFRGKMVVLLSGKSSGLRDVDGMRLFRVRGTCPDDVRAVQVAEVAASLCSDDVFLLQTPQGTFLWIGSSSNEDEQRFGVAASSLISPESTVIAVREGEESDSFWESLGGKGPYSSTFQGDGVPLLGPRLFHCYFPPSDVSRIRIQEISQFTQQDLQVDDVMILDSGEEIYVWIGNDSSETEKSLSIEAADKYLQSDPTDRDKNHSVVLIIKQNEEPTSFKVLFPNWQDDLWESLPSYEDLKNEITQRNCR